MVGWACNPKCSDMANLGLGGHMLQTAAGRSALNPSPRAAEGPPVNATGHLTQITRNIPPFVFPGTFGAKVRA